MVLISPHTWTDIPKQYIQYSDSRECEQKGRILSKHRGKYTETELEY